MKFKQGDRVRLLVGKKYNDVTIPAGTEGVVTKVYKLGENYLVAFDGFSPPNRRVLGTQMVGA